MEKRSKDKVIPTPESVLDLMCDLLLKRDRASVVKFDECVQYFWRRGWKLHDVRDPKDSDPLRYALKACFLERMAEVWSSAPKHRPSEAPAWCASVPAVTEHFSVIPEKDADYFRNVAPSAVFQKRNIYAPENMMFFV